MDSQGCKVSSWGQQRLIRLCGCDISEGTTFLVLMFIYFLSNPGVSIVHFLPIIFAGECDNRRIARNQVIDSVFVIFYKPGERYAIFRLSIFLSELVFPHCHEYLLMSSYNQNLLLG